jgi:hypothetical protein
MMSDVENLRSDMETVTRGVEMPGVSEPSFVEALADPVSVFAHPSEVVQHPWFSDQEKRAILLSWARDELVIEQVASRAIPDLKLRSRMDAVLAALERFDPDAAAEFQSAIAAVRGGLVRRCRRRERVH